MKNYRNEIKAKCRWQLPKNSIISTDRRIEFPKSLYHLKHQDVYCTCIGNSYEMAALEILNAF